MKILIDARLYGLEHGGLGRYTLNLIEELTKIDEKNEYTALLRKKYFNQLKLPDNWEKILADFRHYGLTEQIRLPQMGSEYSPDISHFPHLNVPIFYTGRFVVTIHDLIMHRSKGRRTTTLPSYKYFLKRLGYKQVFRNAVYKAARVIVPSEYVKRQLGRHYNLDEDKITVTYEGFDEKITSTQKGNGLLKKHNLTDKYFIYVGNAYPHKNLDRAIEAVVLLNKKRREKVQFAIASARSVFTERLKETVASLGAERYVKLLGFVPDAELGTLLKNSSAFVYPSLNEGFGLQGLEAIASATLVIASNIPVFKEVYKDHVLYFNPYDFSSITRLMEDVLKMDRKERERIIIRSQRFIKRYSWAKMARQTLKVYEEAVRS